MLKILLEVNIITLYIIRKTIIILYSSHVKVNIKTPWSHLDMN